MAGNSRHSTIEQTGAAVRPFAGVSGPSVLCVPN